MPKASAIAAIKVCFTCDARRDRVALVIKSIRKLKQGRYTRDVANAVLKTYVKNLPDDVKECAMMRLRRMATTLDAACASCLSNVCTCVTLGRLPVKKELREGTQYGACANASSNVQPRSPAMLRTDGTSRSWRKS